MTRIACAWIPRFELALLARREGGDLLRQPLAIADLSASSAVVLEATPAAARAGVYPGMTVAQARVRCGSLVVRPPEPDARAVAEAAILAALGRLAPRLAADGRGAFFLGLAGMGRLVRDERGYAAAVRDAVGSLGFAASVGIAGHPFAAWVAARRRAGPVAPGADARFLASVPLASLGLSEPARALLALLGITTAGQVARLPRGALGRRLGAEGERLDRLCRGELLLPETMPTTARVPRPPAAIGLDLENRCEGLEPILFILKGLLDRLLARVAAERTALAELTVEAELDDPGRSRVERRLVPAEPTLDSRVVADLIRLWLEGRPFDAPPRALRLVASRLAPASARQLRLYARREDGGRAALERAVARLAAVFGEGAVVRPALADRLRPEGRLVWLPALPGAGARGAAGGPGAPRGPEAPSAGGEAERAATGAAAQGPPALRLLAVPEPVELAGGAGSAPRLLRRHGQRPRRVVRVEGVQRVSGEWWEAPFDRTYFWAVCEGGERFWLFRDHLRSRPGPAATFLHAVAD